MAVCTVNLFPSHPNKLLEQREEKEGSDQHTVGTLSINTPVAFLFRDPGLLLRSDGK